MTYPRYWSPRRRGRHAPPPFVRKFGCIFAAMLLSALFGAGTLVTTLVRAPQRAVSTLLIGMALLAVLAAAFVTTVRGVTRTFRAQDALRRQLMADVAHELRTPLAILQGRIEGLLDGVYPRDDERLDELLEETRHLSRLVEDLRTIANAEAGALELKKETFDLAELIRDVAASFDRPIEVDAPAELMIDADPLRIREVLLNLLSNAVRHTPAEGRVRIEAAQKTIRVSDTGSGIPAEELPRIFDRFHKGRDSRGSGLGLAIARNLVKAHGGTIEAKSRVGEGTTVTVSL